MNQYFKGSGHFLHFSSREYYEIFMWKNGVHTGYVETIGISKIYEVSVGFYFVPM
jgi:hypothetical protein